MINRKYRLLPFLVAEGLILLRVGADNKIVPANMLITGWLQPIVFVSLMVAYVILAFPSLQGKRFLCTVRRYHVQSLKNQDICETCGLDSSKVKDSGWFAINHKYRCTEEHKSGSWEEKMCKTNEEMRPYLEKSEFYWNLRLVIPIIVFLVLIPVAYLTSDFAREFVNGQPLILTTDVTAMTFHLIPLYALIGLPALVWYIFKMMAIHEEGIVEDIRMRRFAVRDAK